jgi:hypothetical protein
MKTHIIIFYTSTTISKKLKNSYFVDNFNGLNKPSLLLYATNWDTSIEEQQIYDTVKNSTVKNSTIIFSQHDNAYFDTYVFDSSENEHKQYTEDQIICWLKSNVRNNIINTILHE